MKLLVKDHKKMGEDGLPPTRPVVSASGGMNVAFSNLLSDILEPIARAAKNTGEVISSEHLLNKIEALNKNWEDKEKDTARPQEVEEYQEGVGGGEDNLPVGGVAAPRTNTGVEVQTGATTSRVKPVLVAADAMALYPSLDRHECARVVREEVIKSEVVVEGTNWREMARYLAITSDPWEWSKWGVRPFIPTKIHNVGPDPGITGKEALGASLGSNQWSFPNLTPTKHQERLLLAACLGVGVRETFALHTYTFGGQYFLQLAGGPIGLRLTCVVAKFRMINWMRELVTLLEKAGLRVLLAEFYVDDIRLVLDWFDKGYRWDAELGSLSFREEWWEQDDILNLEDDERMGNVILTIMNQISRDLNFTMEVASQFPDKTIPTLDFQLWLDTPELSHPRLYFKFFSKPMASQYVELELSARAWSAKSASLTQEVYRRLQNTSQHLPKEIVDRTLEEFTAKMLDSGYSRVQTRTVMEAGIKGFYAKLERGSVRRPVHMIQEGRELRKILEKSTWYLPRERQDPLDGTRDGQTPGGEGAPGRSRRWSRQSPYRGVGGPQDQHQKSRNPFAPVAPIFIPRTQGGALINVLRGVETRLAGLGGKVMPRLKLVEQGGIMLRSILTKSDPWRDAPCGHPQCTTCRGEKPGTCRTRSIVYGNTCLACKEEGRKTIYIGESARTMAERGREHQADALSKSKGNKTSHMREHVVEEHGGRLENLLDLFRMDIIKVATSAIERQVREAVEIGRAGQGVLLLNRKEEYNRCLLPRLLLEGPKSVGEQEEGDRERGRQTITQQQEEEALQVARRDHKVRMLAYKEERGPPVKRIRMEPTSSPPPTTPTIHQFLDKREEQQEKETEQEQERTEQPSRPLTSGGRRTMRGGRRLPWTAQVTPPGPGEISTSPYRGVGGPQPAPTTGLTQPKINAYFQQVKDDGKEKENIEEDMSGKEDLEEKEKEDVEDAVNQENAMEKTDDPKGGRKRMENGNDKRREEVENVDWKMVEENLDEEQDDKEGMEDAVNNENDNRRNEMMKVMENDGKEDLKEKEKEDEGDAVNQEKGDDKTDDPEGGGKRMENEGKMEFKENEKEEEDAVNQGEGKEKTDNSEGGRMTVMVGLGDGKEELEDEDRKKEEGVKEREEGARKTDVIRRILKPSISKRRRGTVTNISKDDDSHRVARSKSQSARSSPSVMNKRNSKPKLNKHRPTGVRDIRVYFNFEDKPKLTLAQQEDDNPLIDVSNQDVEGWDDRRI